MFSQKTIVENSSKKWEASLHSHRKEQLFAWLLLSVLCLQRILGLVGHDLVYMVEEASGMTELEMVVSEKVKRETGADVQVRIQKQDQLELLQMLGYSAPFIFSKEIGDTTLYYTLEYTSPRVIQHTFAEPGSTDPLELPNSTRFLKEVVLSKFFWWETGLTFWNTPAERVSGKTVPHFWDDSFISVPSPPPRLA